MVSLGKHSTSILLIAVFFNASFSEAQAMDEDPQVIAARAAFGRSADKLRAQIQQQKTETENKASLGQTTTNPSPVPAQETILERYPHNLKGSANLLEEHEKKLSQYKEQRDSMIQAFQAEGEERQRKFEAILKKQGEVAKTQKEERGKIIQQIKTTREENHKYTKNIDQGIKAQRNPYYTQFPYYSQPQNPYCPQQQNPYALEDLANDLAGLAGLADDALDYAKKHPIETVFTVAGFAGMFAEDNSESE